MAMATNGNSTEQASNATLQAVLRAAEAAPPAPHAMTHDMMAIVTQFTQHLRDTGRLLAGNGAEDAKDATAFADHVVKLFRDWAAGTIARKRQELADLERFIGKVGK
jgi:hypothetical protein